MNLARTSVAGRRPAATGPGFPAFAAQPEKSRGDAAFRRLIVLGILLLLLTVGALALHIPGAGTVGSPERKTVFVALLGLAALVQFGAVAIVLRGVPRRTVWVVIAIAVAARIGPLIAPPFLSTDIFRYVWDGRVQAAGINPYAFLPADSSADRAAGRRNFPAHQSRRYRTDHLSTSGTGCVRGDRDDRARHHGSQGDDGRVRGDGHGCRGDGFVAYLAVSRAHCHLGLEPARDLGLRGQRTCRCDGGGVARRGADADPNAWRAVVRHRIRCRGADEIHAAGRRTRALAARPVACRDRDRVDHRRSLRLLRQCGMASGRLHAGLRRRGRAVRWHRHLVAGGIVSRRHSAAGRRADLYRARRACRLAVWALGRVRAPPIIRCRNMASRRVC
jgi:hypothetical protein